MGMASVGVKSIDSFEYSCLNFLAVRARTSCTFRFFEGVTTLGGAGATRVPRCADAAAAVDRVEDFHGLLRRVCMSETSAKVIHPEKHR